MPPRRRRNYSMQAYWERISDAWEPELAFRGRSVEDWRAWRERALPRLLELLGPTPDPVPLDAEVECVVEDDDLIRERVVMDVEAHMAVPCWLLRPRDMPADGSLAAILCCHGHGPYGKDAVAGIRGSEGHTREIAAANYDYGVQLARAGYVTLCPDLRGFGERRDGPDPFPGRDPCNVNYVKGTLLGINTLALNIWDMRRCLDYLQTRPEVDPQRLGMIGLSLGGTMTAFTAAVEPRIAAADVIGYVNPWRRFGLERANFCGSQIVPGIHRAFDTHDIAGLIAPRPLLLEMGIHDQCFYIQDLLAGYEGVRRIYAAAGAEEHLWAEVHSGGHAFAGNRALAFFARYL